MKLKKMTALLLAFAITTMCLASCGNKEETSSTIEESTASTTESSEVEKTPETDEEWNQAMLDKAMVSYGNTSLVQNVITKAQSGDETTIAYLGGSITEGYTVEPDECYASLTYNYFADKFGTGDNVKYCNAGLSGTPSKLGILRLERDVLSSNPDMVFIEYAVNDGSDPDYQNAYESIVKTLLQKDIAVVLLFSVAKDDHSAQDYMKQIGEAYQLPMISYCDALRYMFANNRMTWDDFSNDEAHPNPEGHKLVASMIDYYFDTVMDVESTGDYVMPMEDVFSPREVDAHLLENTNITPVSMGSWEEGTTVAGFKSGWTHTGENGNDPIVFEIDAQFVYLIFYEINQGNLGRVHIKTTCDGEVYDESDYDPIISSAWGDPGVQNLVMQPTTMKCRIEISMAEGDEDKYYQILGLGYTE